MGQVSLGTVQLEETTKIQTSHRVVQMDTNVL